jgi:5-methylthioadenosine/S-adenosylhomocysteine deaminase
MDHLVGEIAPGKKADIIIIDTHKPHLTPMYHECSHLVYTVAGADVDTVLINGQVVMKNRRLLTIDEDEVMAKVQEIGARIKAGMGIAD